MPTRECSIEGCAQKHYSRTFCRSHYRRFNAYGDPLAARGHRAPAKVCSVEGCERPYYSLSLCKTHHKNFKEDGHTNRKIRDRAPNGTPKKAVEKPRVESVQENPAKPEVVRLPSILHGIRLVKRDVNEFVTKSGQKQEIVRLQCACGEEFEQLALWYKQGQIHSCGRGHE